MCTFSPINVAFKTIIKLRLALASMNNTSALLKMCAGQLGLYQTVRATLLASAAGLIYCSSYYVAYAY